MLMKKYVSFVWDKVCQKDFEDIKEYLTKPSVLVALTSERPLLLYVKVMDYSLGAILAQKNDEGHEHAIYYLNRTLIGAEFRHNPIEKECLAVIFAIQKRRHYLVGQTIHAIFRVNPLCILMTKPGSLNSRLAKWAILLSQNDMLFVLKRRSKVRPLQTFWQLIRFRRDQSFMKIFQMRFSNLI